MRLTESEEDRMLELEGKQALTLMEENELQVLLDRYYDQHIKQPAANVQQPKKGPRK